MFFNAVRLLLYFTDDSQTVFTSCSSGLFSFLSSSGEAAREKMEVSTYKKQKTVCVQLVGSGFRTSDQIVLSRSL